MTKVFKISIEQSDKVVRNHFLYAHSKGEALRLATQRGLRKEGDKLINVERIETHE